MSAYTPLYGPEDARPTPASADTELRLARDLVDKLADTNIHDHTAILKAAVSLDHRLRSLIAALDAERGEGQ
ncbi:hypothetical protein [Streptomyces sp. AMCC400023]|uniref:hypothetical protein n=1 Tax=Streptomyces sp. AMCC400023 TaxID=2056258 RepID=UPI001F2E72AA|nr:hypothetical protein [Streptomyces sp. AMCC400023]UJV41604.1 hypothetical protein CVT30_18645 [Streptomyces sp. AMCC400023]